MGTAKLPRPGEPRKEIAPEPPGSDAPPPGPEHQSRNSAIVWLAVAVLLLAAGLSWQFRIGGTILTFAFMFLAVILIMLNVLGLRKPPA
jgi:hypothetical protein